MNREFAKSAKQVSRRERPYSHQHARKIVSAAKYKRPESPNAAYNSPGRGPNGESSN